jgi:Fe(II)/alpha-ketoglutarate-dependent arginine beta-hydroxylase
MSLTSSSTLEQNKSNTHTPHNRFKLTDTELTDTELQATKDLIDECLNRFKEFDDPLFLKDLPLNAYKLPFRLMSFLNEFKYAPPPEGYCVLSTGLISDNPLGPTPSHWELKTNNDTCQDALMFLCLCSTILGDIFGWETQQDGRVIHDILPIKRYENEQLGCGCREELTWHTEDAFNELRGDYLVMMCLRNNEKIPTTLSKPDYSKLTTRQRNILFEKHFIIRPDNSHKTNFASSERTKILDDNDSVELIKMYSTTDERDNNPEKVAVLFGNKADPCLRLDPYFMDVPDDPEIQDAFNAIIELVTESLVEVSLNQGEILIVDNYEVVHGRRPFKARYDGTDRWYKRINVIRDIRRCQEVMKTKKSRVIY